MTLGRFDRPLALRSLGDSQLDVLVIGGGITGAGAALDAASRGLRTGLVERHDFASGTSSKSSKLVHGGLRYLQQKELGLVYEGLAERQRLLGNAPHLVREQPFLLPVLTRDGLFDRKVARALGSALWMYDLTGGLRIGKAHRRVGKDEALALLPALDPDRVAGGYLYYDCAADDARLTLSLAKSAAIDHGALVANRTSVVGIRRDDGGHVVTVEADGDRFDISTRAVVNATGVWVDRVRALDEQDDPKTLRPAKGIHVTVRADRLAAEVATIVPVRGDRRSVFVVPWGDFAYIGTTDTDYDGPLDDPKCTGADIDYLLSAINAATSLELTRADVTGTWAGLRPLVRGAADGERTSDLSRRHRVEVTGSGIISVTGGKLTTYRAMAADAVDAAVARIDDPFLPRSTRRSRTAKLRLHGGNALYDARALLEERADIDERWARHLLGRHGSEVAVVLAMIDSDPTLAARLSDRLPYLAVEVVYAARYEMVDNLDDVLARRTRARLRDARATIDIAPRVGELIAPELGWSQERIDDEVDRFVASVGEELTPLESIEAGAVDE